MNGVSALVRRALREPLTPSSPSGQDEVASTLGKRVPARARRCRHPALTPSPWGCKKEEPLLMSHAVCGHLLQQPERTKMGQVLAPHVRNLNQPHEEMRGPESRQPRGDIGKRAQSGDSGEPGGGGSSPEAGTVAQAAQGADLPQRWELVT